FLQLGFMPRDSQYSQRADAFRREFDKLLFDVVMEANGVVSPDVLKSGEVFTQYTLNAEVASAFYTGIKIPTEITREEMNLTGSRNVISSRRLDQAVQNINKRAIALISSLIQLKQQILNNVLTCKMFTVNYPLLIDHIMREAKLYLKLVKCLQAGEDINLDYDILEQEAFWNRIMAEHAKFIRGLLDPTEDELIMAANNFGKEFDKLTDDAKAAMDKAYCTDKVTADSLAATKAIRDFKAQGTAGLIDCKIRSIIIPLLGDHTLREANHYLRLLKIFAR
ncbi:MAG: DUF2935 domain-containing protein, partial [Clostridiales bacterium]|nr:DUF2935 domain-containing protein [Clostridiales bacterium]